MTLSADGAQGAAAALGSQAESDVLRQACYVTCWKLFAFKK